MARVAVVGAGPAGVAAAVQLSRCGHRVVVYEAGAIGGAVRNARLVENYPGFPDGISGWEFAGLLEKHLRNYVDDIRYEQVDQINRLEEGFQVSTQGQSELFEGVVVSTGTASGSADFDGEDVLARSRLLHYEVVDLDSRAELNKVAVVGGGEAALDYALNMARNGAEVTVLHRSELRANHALLSEVETESKIDFVLAKVTGSSIEGGKAVLCWDDHSQTFDIVLVAVGREPRLPRLVGIDLDNFPPNFHIAGDARHGRLGQVAIAVGDGLKAAMQLHSGLGGRA